MADLNLKAMVGTRDFYRIDNNNDWVELPDVEETNGGGIQNNSQEYTPHDTGIKAKVVTTQEYNDVIINVGKNTSDNAYGNNTVTILNDLAKNRTKFMLAKAVPAGASQYEVTVWTGHLTQATTDEANASNIQRGSFTMSVSSREEKVGTISATGELTLSDR